jgi:hypothetical protein
MTHILTHRQRQFRWTIKVLERNVTGNLMIRSYRSYLSIYLPICHVKKNLSR